MSRKLFFVLIILLGFVACSGDKESKNPESSCKSDSVNPNGSSELAILMRKMVAGTDSAKQDLLNQRNVRLLPDDITTILTAKKTDPNLNLEIFDPLAQNYLARVSDFYSSTPETKTHNYNLMVNACVNCHQNFCGGPLKRINKLLLPESKNF